MTTTKTQSFHRFPDFPPEIRLQVWQEVLPEKLNPALFTYEKGCWDCRPLTEADEWFNPDIDDGELGLEFNLQWLKGRYFVPLAFVNREARYTALSWAREQGLEVSYIESTRFPVFTRHFNPEYDTLYVPASRWDEFIEEPAARMKEPDLMERTLTMLEIPIKQLAIPDILLHRKASSPRQLFRDYSQVTRILIIPTIPASELESTAQIPLVWEYQELSRGVYTWDTHSEAFHIEGTVDMKDPICSLMKKAAKHLSRDLAGEGYSAFQLQRAEIVDVGGLSGLPNGDITPKGATATPFARLSQWLRRWTGDEENHREFVM